MSSSPRMAAFLGGQGGQGRHASVPQTATCQPTYPQSQSHFHFQLPLCSCVPPAGAPLPGVQPAQRQPLPMSRSKQPLRPPAPSMPWHAGVLPISHPQLSVPCPSRAWLVHRTVQPAQHGMPVPRNIPSGHLHLHLYLPLPLPLLCPHYSSPNRPRPKEQSR